MRVCLCDQSQKSFDLPALLWLVLLAVTRKSLITACWPRRFQMETDMIKMGTDRIIAEEHKAYRKETQNIIKSFHVCSHFTENISNPLTVSILSFTCKLKPFKANYLKMYILACSQHILQKSMTFKNDFLIFGRVKRFRPPTFCRWLSKRVSILWSLSII